MYFDQTRNFCYIKHMPKMSGYPNKSCFVIAVPLPFSSPFNTKHKNAFIWVCWHFRHMFDKTKVSRMIKIHILSFMVLTFFARILYMLSPKIRAERVRVIKDKICIFIIRETFVLSSICQKCQHTQIKAFLCFGIKEKNTKRGGSLYFSFNSKHKNAFIWVPWQFGI